MTRHKAYTKIPFAALVFAATLISPALHALNIPDYRFHTMPETSYYGGIHSIAKDSVGRMWFSGYDALFMYNGTSFVRMTDLVTNLLPNSYWSYGQVITDNRKGLYVGTNQGLLRFNYRKLEFEFVLEGNIGSVTANNDGTVWLIRNNGIESFSPERLPAVTRYPMPPEMSAPGRTLTLVCTKEYVYAASGGDLYRLNRETGQYVLFASVGGGSCVIRDVVECNGSVYVLTLMDGLYECDGNGRIGRYFRLPLEYEKSAGAKELHLDSQGIIWVATQSGLLLLEPLTASTQLLRSDLHYPYSLPNNSVWSIFPDPDGGIWVGTYGGKLAYMTFADNGVDYFKATPGGLNHPIVSCFEEDSEGNRRRGVVAALLRRNRSQDQQPFPALVLRELQPVFGQRGGFARRPARTDCADSPAPGVYRQRRRGPLGRSERRVPRGGPRHAGLRVVRPGGTFGNGTAPNRRARAVGTHRPPRPFGRPRHHALRLAAIREIRGQTPETII